MNRLHDSITIRESGSVAVCHEAITRPHEQDPLDLNSQTLGELPVVITLI